MPLAKNQLGAVENLVVRDRLVDDAAQAVGSCLGRNRQRLFAALAQPADDVVGVRSSRRSDAGLIE